MNIFRLFIRWLYFCVHWIYAAETFAHPQHNNVPFILHKIDSIHGNQFLLLKFCIRKIENSIHDNTHTAGKVKKEFAATREASRTLVINENN